MHLLRLFLTAWLAFGIVTVFFLFWLCTRTARRLNDIEPLTPLNDSVVPSYGDRRISRRDEFFWRVATAIAMVAVSAMLLVPSLDRLSPLPAGLELVHHKAPFRRVLPQSGGVATKTIMMEPQATKTERAAVADTPPGGATPSSFQKIGNPKRHSAYESEAGVVAQDTVVGYGRRPPGSSQEIGNPKRYSAYESEADVVAQDQDTVVHYGRRRPGSSQKIGNPKRHSAYESEADVVAQDTVVRYGRRPSR
jgi:hypothetical protein